MQDDETGTEPYGGTGWPATGYGEPGGRAGGGRAGGPAGAGGPGNGGDGAWARPDGDYAGPPRRRRRSRRVAVYAIVAVLAAGLGAAATVGLNGGQTAPSYGVSSHQVPGPQNDAGNTASGKLNKAYVAARVEPAVVDIEADIQYSGGTSSEGTGMVLSTDGLVLTNNHVINGARTIRVTLATTGRGFSATVVGYDATHDVALLRLNGAAGLKVVAVGNSAQVTLGTPVLALGNAEGQGGLPALAQGTINSLDKTISPTDESTGATETLHGMLQTSASIVSGDSGGPLANAAGQVIGMDTANASSSQGSSSVLGYAIPINTALSVADQIAAGQASATVQIGLPGFLGVLVPQSNSTSPAEQASQQRRQIQQQQQSHWAAARPAPAAGPVRASRCRPRPVPTTTRTPRCRRPSRPPVPGPLWTACSAAPPPRPPGWSEGT